jgi:hypothetical protein
MFLVEDPIRAEHMHGYRHIRQHTNVPLAAGEQWANKWEFRQAIGNLVSFRPSNRLIVLVLLAAFVLCVLGSLFPAWRAVRMLPAEALRRI